MASGNDALRKGLSMRKRAFVSVFDKTGLDELGKGLVACDVDIISTGGTSTSLTKAGIPNIKVEEVTGFPEMLDGRLKTLHPKVHGAILFRRGTGDEAVAREHGIEPIDFVIVNLYPFAQTAAREGATSVEIIEKIDIGGPALLRSAAKNHDAVTAIVDPADYHEFLRLLRTQGEIPFMNRVAWARKVFRATAEYDRCIAFWFELFGDRLTRTEV